MNAWSRSDTASLLEEDISKANGWVINKNVKPFEVSQWMWKYKKLMAQVKAAYIVYGSWLW